MHNKKSYYLIFPTNISQINLYQVWDLQFKCISLDLQCRNIMRCLSSSTSKTSKISKDIPAQDPEENCNKALLWEETEEFKVNSHGRGSSQILDLKHRVWNNFYYAELPCVLCPDISTMLQKIQGHVVRVLNVYGDDADRTGIPFPPLQSMLWNEKKGEKKCTIYFGSHYFTEPTHRSNMV